MIKKLAFLLLFSLSACQLSPPRQAQADIQTIAEKLPQQWQWTVEQAQGEQVINWWESYNNKQLNQLVNQALTENYSLKAAGFSLQQAMLGKEKQRQQQQIQINGHIHASSSTQLNKASIHLQKSYSSNIGISYLIDYLGKNSLMAEKETAGIQATGEDLQAARQAVVGAVINRFITLAYLDDRLQLNAKQLHFARQNQGFAMAKYQAGSLSKLDFLQFQQPIANLEQQRQQFIVERREQQAALAALLGKSSPVNIKPKGLASLTLALPKVGIPAYLLAQRPDLRAAQYRLQQSIADIDLTERDFYPQITLGGSIGTSADKLWQLLRNPTAALTAGLNLPFLQQQEKVLAQKQTEIRYQQALNEFQQKLVDALSETQQILLSLEKTQYEETFLQQKWQQAKEIEHLTRMSYQAGATSLQTLLEKENATRQEEEALLNNHQQQLQQSVRLHLALGGKIRE